MSLRYSREVELIKAEAARLGFDACGIAKADSVTDAPLLKDWLEDGCAAEMHYMHNHFEKRTDPRLLVDGARSVIVVALNYYPKILQNPDVPQFSYYAYGKDYHEVVKEKLRQLYTFINDQIATITGRVFTDSAPVLERYWALKAGIGFIGKHTQLIIPGKGSYFFLGELIIDLDLPSDTPIKRSCGNCTRCLDACPPKALTRPGRLDAMRCISYQTIENKGEINPVTAAVLGNCVYGCDICQKVCPWNRFAKPNETIDFLPSDAFLSLDSEQLNHLTESDFKTIFKYSAVKRAGYKGLMRNFRSLNFSSSDFSLKKPGEDENY